MDPARDVALHLAGLGVGSTARPTSGWWIVTSQLVSDPLPQIAVFNSAGAVPQGSLGGGMAYRRRSVQALVLGPPNDYVATQAKVEEVFQSLYRPSGVLVGSNAYLSWLPREPMWLGYREEDGRPMWSINVEILV